MPMIIKNIDEIARQKQCDVAFLTFEDLPAEIKKQSKHEQIQRFVFGVVDWITHPSRIQIIRWLSKNNIPWSPCAGLSNSGIITGGYQGQIYLDVPYDANKPEDQQHPLFKKCLSFLEDNAGQVKWEGVRFYGLTLNRAIEIEYEHKKLLSRDRPDKEA